MQTEITSLPRTSKTDPLRIDELPVKGGLFGITLMPGLHGISMSGPPWARDIRTDMEALRAWKPDVIVVADLHEELDIPFRVHFPKDSGVVVHRLHTQGFMPVSRDALYDALEAVSCCLRDGDGEGRVLFISCRGMKRAGLLMAFALIDQGLSDHMAVQLVNETRAEAVETQRHFDLLREFRENPRPRPVAVFKREDQPPGIIAAKAAARRLHEAKLAKEPTARLSAALEAIAIADGFRDWNTLTAMLSQKRLHRPVHSQGQLALYTLLELDKQDPDLTMRVLEYAAQIGSSAEGMDLWRQRSLSYIQSVVPPLFAMHQHYGTSVGLRDLIATLNGWPELNLDVLTRAAAAGKITGQALLALRAFTNTLPGYSTESALTGSAQGSKTQEQAGYAIIMVRGYLRELCKAKGIALTTLDDFS